MSYRRIALILLSGLIIWCFSKIFGLPGSNTVEGANLAATPISAANRQLRPDVIRKLYLPLVMKANFIPPAPPATTSRYVATNDPNTMYTAGCNQGKAGESGTVILDFGYPDINPGTYSDYGTALLSLGHPFVDNVDEEYLAQRFIDGWLGCAPSNATLDVALGLNNSPKYWSFTAAQASLHGADWAFMVADLAHQYSSNPDPNVANRVFVDGAMDIEFSYNTFPITRAWVDAFTPGPSVFFYNFGSCDDCPWFQHPGWPPNNGWTTDNIYYVSMGMSSNETSKMPFPQIYTTNGENADQWYRVSLYGANTYHVPLFFDGVLTQYYACKYQDNWPGCVSAGTINTPAQGWTGLWQALSANPLTAPYGPVASSDIRWDTTNVGPWPVGP